MVKHLILITAIIIFIIIIIIKLGCLKKNSAYEFLVVLAQDG
jgi:hypothetical protein